MATDKANRPYGCRFAYTKHGGPPQLTKHKAGSSVIYIGDPVWLSAGRVYPVSASTNVAFGVANSYVQSGNSSDPEVFVYDDLVNTVFQIQAGDSALQGDTLVGDLFDLSSATGSTVTGLSSKTILGAQSTYDTFKLVGLVNKPGNDYWGGKYTDVYVEFYTQQTLPASSVVGD